MTLEEARAILGVAVQPDGSLDALGHYMEWKPGDKTIILDDDFTADELEAMAVHMRATKP